MKFLRLILLCTILSTHVFCMRMTETHKKYAQKRLQPIQQQRIQTSLQQIYEQKIRKKTSPIIFYDSRNKRIELNYVKDNILASEPPAAIFTNIMTYNMSPQKKYLLIHTGEKGTPQPESSLTEKLIKTTLETATGRTIGEKINVSSVTKMIDIYTQKEIASFNGNLITYEFSPDEQTLLVARKVLGIEHSTKGALERGQRTSQDSTRYELFDIASQTVVKTFENIQSMSYEAEDNLLVQYDNGSTEQITLQRNSPLSYWNKIKNQSQHQNHNLQFTLWKHQEIKKMLQLK